MYCDGCGTQLQESQRFCSTCGKPAGIAVVPYPNSRVASHHQLLGILWVVYSFFVFIGGGILFVMANTFFVNFRGGAGTGQVPFSLGFLQPLLSFVAVAVGIVSFQMLILAVTALGFSLPVEFTALPFDGFSQNRNAFAFILILSICASPMIAGRAHGWMLGVLFSGIWFAGSRARSGARRRCTTIPPTCSWPVSSAHRR